MGDDRVTEKDLAVMYLGVSAHIGNVVMQSSSGLRSVSRGYGMPLGRVQAEMTGETPKGGIWEGEKGYFSVPVVGATPTGQFTTQISPSYVENAQFLEHAKKATADQVAALDAIETVGMELGAEFIMAPGMLYFLNNHQVYHGRGNWSVTDNEAKGEWGNEGRLLFRTWISPYNSRPLPDTPEYRNVWGSVEGGKPRGGWDQAVKTGDSPKPNIPADHVYYSLFDDEVQKKSMEGHCSTVLEY